MMCLIPIRILTFLLLCIFYGGVGSKVKDQDKDQKNGGEPARLQWSLTVLHCWPSRYGRPRFQPDGRSEIDSSHSKIFRLTNQELSRLTCCIDQGSGFQRSVLNTIPVIMLGRASRYHDMNHVSSESVFSAKTCLRCVWWTCCVIFDIMSHLGRLRRSRPKPLKTSKIHIWTGQQRPSNQRDSATTDGKEDKISIQVRTKLVKRPLAYSER